MEGFIPDYRSVLDWEWFTTPLTAHLFRYLMLKAAINDIRIAGIEIKRGSLRTTRQELAVRTGLSEQEVRTAIKHLELSGDIVCSSTNKYTIITICRYDNYTSQSGYNQPTTNQQSTNNQPTTNQQSTNNQPTINQQSTNLYKENDNKDNNLKIQEDENNSRTRENFSSSLSKVGNSDILPKEPEGKREVVPPCQQDYTGVKSSLKTIIKNMKEDGGYKSYIRNTFGHIYNLTDENYVKALDAFALDKLQGKDDGMFYVDDVKNHFRNMLNKDTRNIFGFMRKVQPTSLPTAFTLTPELQKMAVEAIKSRVTYLTDQQIIEPITAYCKKTGKNPTDVINDCIKSLDKEHIWGDVRSALLNFTNIPTMKAF